MKLFNQFLSKFWLKEYWQERNQDVAKGGAWKWKNFCNVILIT